MTNDEALLVVVGMLAKEGVTTRISAGDSGLTAWFDNGFYKSDGCARLEVKEGRLLLIARYNESTEINSIDDVIRCSKKWHEFSADRGWASPPLNWLRLYERISD